jgi:hypothetical protein
MALFKGIAFPFHKGNISFPDTVQDEELIRQSIIRIILSPRGERVMRPQFGSGALDMVFDNNDDVFSLSMQRAVRSAIGQYEPRVIVTNVQVDRNEEGNESVVTITYVIPSLGTQAQLAVAVPMP